MLIVDESDHFIANAAPRCLRQRLGGFLCQADLFESIEKIESALEICGPRFSLASAPPVRSLSHGH
jgi:hypothetical protein